jgi:transposase
LQSLFCSNFSLLQSELLAQFIEKAGIKLPKERARNNLHILLPLPQGEGWGGSSITPLPAYSPDYHPIEKLWKNTKCDATHLKYFKTFEDLHDSVVKTFKSYMQDASKIICVMQKMREDFSMVC